MNANRSLMNAETHFSQIPNVSKSRSRFSRNGTHKTTYNTGDLIVINLDEVLPGDTITADFAHVTRMMTPIAPVMDNAFLDVYAFFVPCRLLWEHWKEFWGENNQTHWEQPIEYAIPQIEAPSGGWNTGSLADYMGIPVGVEISVNALPFRGYCKIVNDWFRDENLKDPCYITIDETTLTGKNKGQNYDYVTDTELGAAPYKVAKIHDYFTSCLLSPQKGPSVTLPLGQEAYVRFGDNEAITPGSTNTALIGANAIVGKDAQLGNLGEILPFADDGTDLRTSYDTNKGNRLIADLSTATAATINALRQAFAVQRFFEAQGRGGSRYIEFVQNIFGVTSPDARQQRSEYLGGKRFNINVDQVLQTSATDQVTPQGNTAAYSCTINRDNLCTYSATEHGYFYVLGCIRTTHSYAQGLEKMWSRKKWVDFYIPQFANLGETGVTLKEIYAQDDTVVDADGNKVNDQIFGYQEAWAEYRYKPSRVSGLMRPNVTGSLAIWNYTDLYNAVPQLSGDWIDETEENVKRTLAVQNEPQFLSDFYVPTIWTRVMPMYSVPGLLDHH